jgi:hypothetical protein
VPYLVFGGPLAGPPAAAVHRHRLDHRQGGVMTLDLEGPADD